MISYCLAEGEQIAALIIVRLRKRMTVISEKFKKTRITVTV